MTRESNPTPPGAPGREGRELLPCPFCHKADAYFDRAGLYGLHFVGCACGARGPARDGLADARDAWNTRAAPPPAPEVRPTSEMRAAVAETIRMHQASGVPPEGVAEMVWRQVAGHVAMLLEKHPEALRGGPTEGK